MGNSVLWILVVMTFVIITQVDAIGYCPSFCDPNGYYHESHHCHAPEIYCCGSAFHRTCCSNRSHDISAYYPDKYNCNTNTWMQVHWQVMITMTGSVLLVLLFSACCCQCCRICNERIEREHRVHFSAENSNNINSIVTDADGNQIVMDSTEPAAEGGQVTIQMFNPESPFAFTPPEYTSLPKDPPKYQDVFSAADGGNLNPCYTPDTPPPPFSEVVAATGPPLPVLPPGVPDDIATPNTNSEATNADNTPVIDNVEDGDVIDGVPETYQTVTQDAFVEVDLSAEAADEIGRPLTSRDQTSHDAAQQEEAREHCLSSDHGDNNDNTEQER